MLVAAAAVLVVLALLHSVLGELLLFRRARVIEGVPALGFPPLAGAPQPPLLTVRACWHALSVLGGCLALVLSRLTTASPLGPGERQIVHAIAAALVVCGVVMLAGTRGKHLGWSGFLVAGALAWLGAG